MKIKSLELSGYINTHDSDVFLEKEKQDVDDYSDVDSIGEIITDHFAQVTKKFEVSYEDWTRGELVHYKDVFVQYYVSDEKMTLQEAEELNIKKLAGDLTVEKRLSGYSEYTITDSWVEIFVGGHDLRKEISSYTGKYVNIKISYKVDIEQATKDLKPVE